MNYIMQFFKSSDPSIDYVTYFNEDTVSDHVQKLTNKEIVPFCIFVPNVEYAQWNKWNLKEICPLIQ